MHNLKLQHLWLTLGMFQVAAIFYLSLTSHPPSVDFKDSDKLGHLIAYGIVMFWFSQLYLRSRSRLLLGSAFILMGITLEFLQGLGGIRMMETADMLANSLGVLIGASLTLLFPRFNLLQSIENMILHKTN